MTATEIQIIGRLFDFLSSYEPEELSKAASSPLVTDNVRNALQALARARAEKRPERAVQTATGNDLPHGDLLETELYKTLLDPAILPTARDIVAALDRVGLRVAASKKDGRARVIERVRRQLNARPVREREKIVKQLLRDLRPTQTEGWFKVIRGEL